MKQVGFIGTGHIAVPMVRFLAVWGHQVTLSGRGAARAAEQQVTRGLQNEAAHQPFTRTLDAIGSKLKGET